MNFYLADSEPSVWLADDDTKNSKAAETSLRPETEMDLKAYFATMRTRRRLPNRITFSHPDLEAPTDTFW